MTTANDALKDRLAARRAWIGASDVAAILGVSPYANAADVYWQKVAQLDGIETAATERGRYVEPAILTWFEDQIGQPLARDVRVECEQLPLLVAQLDGQLPDGTPVEAKSAASDRGPNGEVLWGDEYTDQIPENYIVQAQAQMLATGTEFCHVPALVAGFRKLEFRRYVVANSDALGDAILGSVERFWRGHVEARTPPTDLVPSIETLKRIRRQPASTIELDDALLGTLVEFRTAQDARKRAADIEDDIKARLIAALGEAEAGQMSDGTLLTYLEQNGARRCDFDLLRAHYPEAYGRLVTQTTHRVFRIKAKTKAAQKAA